MSAAIRRIQKELSDITNSIHKEIPENISAGPSNPTNIFLWDAMIIGSVGTPYEGGIFRLKITFPRDYPFHPPVIKFNTRIFHPNISESGDICLDILKNHWSPAYTISQTLLSIVSLLSDPNPDDPLNPEAAQIYKTNRTLYNSTVRDYIHNFSG